MELDADHWPVAEPYPQRSNLMHYALNAPVICWRPVVDNTFTLFVVIEEISVFNSRRLETD